MRVYPHVCGAASRRHLSAISAMGLSPRVWGSLALDGYDLCCVRSIPTCVGQPGWPGVPGKVGQVYPHVCGAARGKDLGTALPRGLSPRVWGSLECAAVYGCVIRSIPTCVGQPTVWDAIKPTIEVYPHVCGAATAAPSPSSLPRGLSPRVWGSHCQISRSDV